MKTVTGIFLGILIGCIHASAVTLPHSILEEMRTEVVCTSASRYTVKHTSVITVLDKEGLDAAGFVCFCDDYSSLKRFSGSIKNAQKKPVRKLSKSDLQTNEYSSSLATDAYSYYYVSSYPSFPFTVEYEWETVCNRGVISYPSFSPYQDYGQQVLKAFYRIELPEGLSCRYKVVNAATGMIRMTDEQKPDGMRVIEAQATDLPALFQEPFALPVSRLFPCVFFSPSEFCYDTTEGSLQTWESYGKWLYGLTEGRDVLDDAFCQRLHQLTANCVSDLEKVKAVYGYLAGNTRYVSIQLGIGGLQPMTASDVCRMGFGDCKGLSNFLHAMLKELDIPSVYTVISTERDSLYKDFVSVSQMDHVILQVPLPGDTLWLECTDATLPVGYVHRMIAGHEALLVKPEGGQLCCLPDYPDSLNSFSRKARIELASDGTAGIAASEVFSLFQYEPVAAVVARDKEKQKQFVRSRVSLPAAEVRGWQFDERECSLPSIRLDYKLDTKQYAHRTGSRLFVPLHAFKGKPYVPRREQRKNPVYVEHGYLDNDSICLRIPEGYEVENLPAGVCLQSPYGNFYSNVEADGTEIRIVFRLLVRRGVYPPDSYSDFLDFRERVASCYEERLVLKALP